MTIGTPFTSSTRRAHGVARFFRTLALAAAVSILLGSCGGSVNQVGEITVEFDEDIDFSQYETFTVLTDELVPEADELETDAKIFIDDINALIVDAMTGPPACMTFIPPEQVVKGEEPDLYAGNGVARRVEEGTQWRCVGGWWWGTWGWFWDPCRWRTPVTVEFEVGSLYLPVGPRPDEDDDPEPVFIGTGRRLLQGNVDLDAAIERTVRTVFEQWPVRRSCAP